MILDYVFILFNKLLHELVKGLGKPKLNEGVIFLKTIYPDRKMQGTYGKQS